MDQSAVKQEVRRRYAQAARGGGCGCGCGSNSGSDCCSPEGPEPLVDYGDLAEALVEGSDLGLGCGMPTRFADLQPGEVVLDLGSGAGIDVFLAAKVVGPAGQVIGVDMTPAMIARARANADRAGIKNVDFRLGEIERLPVTDGYVDVILSNCVINLSQDKPRVFAEMRRVLKPGGRFSVSDIVSVGDVPAEVRQDAGLWASCIAGALDKDEYLRLIEEAGFTQVQVHHLEEYDQFRGDGYGFASMTVGAVASG